MASKATEVDKKFGELLQNKRNGLQLSRKKLAEILTISPQQLEKYEKGVNRLSPSRLVELKDAMNIKLINLIPHEFLDIEDIDNEGAYLWSNLSFKNKKTLVNIMREMKI